MHQFNFNVVFGGGNRFGQKRRKTICTKILDPQLMTILMTFRRGSSSDGIQEPNESVPSAGTEAKQARNLSRRGDDRASPGFHFFHEEHRGQRGPEGPF